MIISPYSKLNGYYVVTKNGKELEKGRVQVPSWEFKEVLNKFELNVVPTITHPSKLKNEFKSLTYRSKSNFTELKLTYLDRF